MDYAIGVVVILVAILQVLLSITAIPAGLWMFSANANMREITRMVKDLRQRVDANGGIPSTCRIHSQLLDRIDRKVSKLAGEPADGGSSIHE